MSQNDLVLSHSAHLMSAKWKALDAREKQVYVDEAKRNKEEFDKLRKRLNVVPQSPLLPKTDTRTRVTNRAVAGMADVLLEDSPNRRLTEELMAQKRFHENRIRELQTELIKEQQILLDVNNKLIAEVRL